MDWSKMAAYSSKAKDIFQMGKDAFGDDNESIDTEKSLFGRKEQEQADLLTVQLEEQKKKQETTLLYVIGGLLLLVFTGIIKIGK